MELRNAGYLYYTCLPMVQSVFVFKTHLVRLDYTLHVAIPLLQLHWFFPNLRQAQLRV